ncbi:hypothetical protein GUITHDRAFT_53747, partial [Guillardia theta CCMP2712]
HTVLVTSEGEVWSFGSDGWDGRLGHGDRRAHGCLGLGHLAACFTPRPVPALAGTPVLEVAAGGAHCVLVTRENVVMAWGLGKFGQLGTGSRSRQMLPVEVTALRRKNIIGVAAAGSFSGFVSEDGSLYMCGCGWDGQLGLGDREGSMYPERVESLCGLRVKDVSAGGRSLTVVTEAGAVHTSGAGFEGQLGRGEQARLSSRFEQVDEALFGRFVLSVSSALGHVVALTRSGEMFSWG